MRKLIDLHLHLDGSVPFTPIKELMTIHGLPTIDDQILRQKLSVGPDCRSFNANGSWSATDCI